MKSVIVSFFVAIASFSFAVLAAEQPVTRNLVSETVANVDARYHEIRLRHRPDVATLRAMRKIFQRDGKIFVEERPDGGINLIVMK